MDRAAANLLQAQLLVEELRRHGVEYFVICPGSRSTPLVAAATLNERLTLLVHHDERGAAYHALGYIRATGQPAAVVTTSGTAATNLHPAVAEAFNDHLPLVLLTADRPLELVDRGANQTINQTRLFGSLSRTYAELDAPDTSVDPPVLLKSVDEAFATDDGPGPIHFNCRFRKPLLPSPAGTRPLDLTDSRNNNELASWLESDKPWQSQRKSTMDIANDELSAIISTVATVQRGLLVIGRLDRKAERKAALRLSHQLGWPTVVDVTSGLASSDQPGIVHHYDSFMASERFAKQYRPDFVLHIGGRFVSTRLGDFLRESRPERYFHNSGLMQRIDPDRLVTDFFDYDNELFCDKLSAAIITAGADHDHLNLWRQAGQTAGQTIDDTLNSDDAFGEPWIARHLSEVEADDRGLFLASSQPVRDFNNFSSAGAGPRPVASNRGVSGIDGTIATATGYARGLNLPTTLVIGDQAFLHDLSSLPLAAESSEPLTIILINNHGGRIFEQLPIAEHTALLERFFVSPRETDFGQIAGGFGIEYVRADSRDRFVETYKSAVRAGRTTIIEAVVEPETSRQQRSALTQTVSAAVERL